MSFSQRAKAAYVVLFLLLGALAAKLASVQVLAAAGDYRAQGQRQHITRVELPEPRGEILDRNGTPLAYSEPGFDLWADPARLVDEGHDLHATATRLARALGGEDRDVVLERLTKPHGNVRLARALSTEEAQRVRELELRGLRLEEGTRRPYTLGPAAAHLIGVVGADGRGLEGLEFSWEDVLSSRAGERELREDAHRRRFDLGDGTNVPALPGANLVLTIDSRLQRALHEEVSRAAERIRPAGGAAVAMDPRTGDVLALVSWPSFEPGERGRAPNEAARNRAVQDAYEPGSTFKSFAVAWALEQGVVQPGESIDCEGGSWPVPGLGRTLRDAHPHGILALETVLVVSSNIGAAKIGRRLGADRLLAGVKAFGFGERTGVGLPGEARGMVWPRTRWSPHTVISVPFGQELAVTPLQLATGYAALVNGGLLVRPRIIWRLEDEERRVLREFVPETPKRVISQATSRQLRAALRRVVEDPSGTGRRARVKGLAVGGKTGTAQKYERDPATGMMRPSKKKLVASFVGFAPADHPDIVCLVLWDEPDAAQSGGAAAAPVVARFLERAFVEVGNL
jgi:cell division protein FtsI (penicillin-binding protein 3)